MISRSWNLNFIRPILMSNPQTVDVGNEYSIASRKINNAVKAARKKADEDILVGLSAEQKYLDFCSSAYWDDKLGFYIPEEMVTGSIKDAAKSVKKGRDIDRCVTMTEDRIPVGDIPKVKSLRDAYGMGLTFVFLKPCKIPPRTGSLMMKARCMMPAGCSLNITLNWDEELIALKTMVEIVAYAGVMCGIGGWRPKFGRYIAELCKS